MLPGCPVPVMYVLSFRRALRGEGLWHACFSVAQGRRSLGMRGLRHSQGLLMTSFPHPRSSPERRPQHLEPSKGTMQVRAPPSSPRLSPGLVTAFHTLLMHRGMSWGLKRGWGCRQSVDGGRFLIMSLGFTIPHQESLGWASTSSWRTLHRIF